MPKTIEQRLVALENTISNFLFGKAAKKSVPAKRASRKTAKKPIRKPARKKKTSKKAAR